jgi:hypothetical protein
VQLVLLEPHQLWLAQLVQRVLLETLAQQGRKAYKVLWVQLVLRAYRVYKAFKASKDLQVLKAYKA